MLFCNIPFSWMYFSTLQQDLAFFHRTRICLGGSFIFSSRQKFLHTPKTITTTMRWRRKTKRTSIDRYRKKSEDDFFQALCTLWYDPTDFGYWIFPSTLLEQDFADNKGKRAQHHTHNAVTRVDEQLGSSAGQIRYCHFVSAFPMVVVCILSSFLAILFTEIDLRCFSWDRPASYTSSSWIV